MVWKKQLISIISMETVLIVIYRGSIMLFTNFFLYRSHLDEGHQLIVRDESTRQRITMLLMLSAMHTSFQYSSNHLNTIDTGRIW